MEQKEAIEIVKKNYPHVGFSGSQFETALRVLVPELAESEDERVRKTLLEYYTRRRDEGQKESFVGVPADSVISWLEKQKYEYEVFEPIESTLEYKEGFKAGIESERQKEQKPAEWSEEDKVMLNKIEYRLKDWESIKEQHGHQIDYTLPSPIKWLKSLRPQLKREDWTDEDSLAIKEIQNALEIYRNNHGISEKQRKKLARWLDIHCNAYPLPAKLYPHWKPSEEQISALERAIVKMHTPNDIDVLAELRDNLKKL